MPRKLKASAFHFGNEVEDITACMDYFYEWLIEKSGKKGWPYVGLDSRREKARAAAGISRRGFFQADDGIFAGVIVTTSDDKVEHYLEERNGKTIIVQKEIDGEPPVQLNFFAIRTDFDNGLYTHYRGSYPYTDFLKDLWWAYKIFVTEVTDGSKAFSVYKRHATGPLASRRSFERQLQLLKSIDTVRLSTPVMLQPDDAPEAPTTRGVSYEIRFKDLRPTREAKNWITWLRDLSVRKNKPRGSVLGTDGENNSIDVDFHKTLEDYLRWRYDDIGNIDTSNIMKHKVVKHLVYQIQTDSLFKTDITNED